MEYLNATPSHTCPKCKKTFLSDGYLQEHMENQCTKKFFEIADKRLAERKNLLIRGPFSFHFFRIHLLSGIQRNVVFFGERHLVEYQYDPESIPFILFIKYLVEKMGKGIHLYGETPIFYKKFADSIHQRSTLSQPIFSLTKLPQGYDVARPNFQYESVDFRESRLGEWMKHVLKSTVNSENVFYPELDDTSYYQNPFFKRFGPHTLQGAQSTHTDPTPDHKQIHDLEVDAGKLVADYYGVKEAPDINVERILKHFSAPRYNDDIKSSYQSSGNMGIMDYGAIELMLNDLASANEHSVFFYGGGEHARVYKDVFLTIPGVEYANNGRKFKKNWEYIEFPTAIIDELKNIPGPPLPDLEH